MPESGTVAFWAHMLMRLLTGQTQVVISPYDRPKTGGGKTRCKGVNGRGARVTMTAMNLSTLAATITSQAAGSARHLVAIAGPPAAGKSTIAVHLCKQIEALGVGCAVVPMDGFHLDNAILEAKGLLPRKGSPNTFDAEGFAHLVSRLRKADQTIYLPVFDRQRDIAIAGADTVEPDCKIVLVEGNYLLLNDAPWNQLSEYWDTTVFINPGLGTVEERILDRWIQHGLDFSDAIDRARDNDLPNAKTVIDGYSAKPNDIVLDETFDIRS